ncbi:hypothetical protein AB0I81_30035 [Nonomuraea sp. NPDC050404]|uniref:hypothetical protein n=1 Tax=Nonomuraea sp. NPDC050404 TaxID=3155783 RepID=UPI00341017E7
MHLIARAAMIAIIATGGIAAITTTPAAAGEGCTMSYSRVYPGPNGEIKGSGKYAEGDMDSDGRTCKNGWWVS